MIKKLEWKDILGEGQIGVDVETATKEILKKLNEVIAEVNAQLD